jgi:hypothetical protein
MLASRTRIPSCVPFRFTAMDPLPLLFAEVSRSVRAANDDAGTLAQPIDLSCPAVVRGSDALPVVSPADIEMVCVGTATGVDDCSRGLVISLCSVATTWAPAGARRIGVYLAVDGPDPRDDDEESFQEITQDWIS